MKVTHFGHACVLVETAGARVLLDPGTLSSGFEELRDLSAILLTHNHPDHLDSERIGALVERNRGAVLLADRESAAELAPLGARAVHDGDHFDFDGVVIDVVGTTHAPIFENIPGSANAGYLIDGGAFFHPGDSFEVPTVPVDVLMLAISGPWLKLGDAIAYLREVEPRVAVPIHEADLTHFDVAFEMLDRLKPARTEFRPIERSVTTDL